MSSAWRATGVWWREIETELAEARATAEATGVTLTLSDQTKITFSNLTSVTPLNGHISMG